MLINTFIHIPGIGPATEKKIWQSNILSWKDDNNFSSSGLSASKIENIKIFTEQSNKHLENNNPNFFEALLPSNQHFRLFPEFRHSCAYLDIETTGLDASCQITTIALYNGRDIKYFIQGKNLDAFLDEIQKYSVLITYNGRSFDIPFIEEYFNVKLPHSQIDLRYILKNLGFKGGLKKCEKALGLDREELDGVDGYFAILLWNEYRRNKNQKALETLLAYNIEDVINLETLMIKAYNLNIRKTQFFETHKIAEPPKQKNPLKADLKTIEMLKHRYY
ncbi:MAG: ribonuclease H-like domain-containing protein [Desulfobacula sp.]|nr:ribonuclease H-like domain-containing protein [Desulfobacula sp.]